MLLYANGGSNNGLGGQSGGDSPFSRLPLGILHSMSSDPIANEGNWSIIPQSEWGFKDLAQSALNPPAHAAYSGPKRHFLHFLRPLPQIVPRNSHLTSNASSAFHSIPSEFHAKSFHSLEASLWASPQFDFFSYPDQDQSTKHNTVDQQRNLLWNQWNPTIVSLKSGDKLSASGYPLESALSAGIAAESRLQSGISEALAAPLINLSLDAVNSHGASNEQRNGLSEGESAGVLSSPIRQHFEDSNYFQAPPEPDRRRSIRVKENEPSNLYHAQ